MFWRRCSLHLFTCPRNVLSGIPKAEAASYAVMSNETTAVMASCSCCSVYLLSLLPLCSITGRGRR